MRRYTAILLILTAIVPALARKTRGDRTVTPATAVADLDARHDTISGERCRGAITVSGFDKPLHSWHESMFVTNNLDSAAIEKAIVTIDYHNAADSVKIHSRRVTVDRHIPPHATQNVTFGSWDRQQSFRYQHTTSGDKRRGRAFYVRLHVDSVITSH